MRFESFMWTILVLVLAGATWNETTSVQPAETSVRFESKDGTGKIPPE